MALRNYELIAANNLAQDIFNGTHWGHLDIVNSPDGSYPPIEQVLARLALLNGGVLPNNIQVTLDNFFTRNSATPIPKEGVQIRLGDVVLRRVNPPNNDAMKGLLLLPELQSPADWLNHLHEQNRTDSFPSGFDTVLSETDAIQKRKLWEGIEAEFKECREKDLVVDWMTIFALADNLGFGARHKATSPKDRAEHIIAIEMANLVSLSDTGIDVTDIDLKNLVEHNEGILSRDRVSDAVDKLVQKRLVTKIEDPGDKRKFTVTIRDQLYFLWLKCRNDHRFAEQFRNYSETDRQARQASPSLI
jgi:hypothetical protein